MEDCAGSFDRLPAIKTWESKRLLDKDGTFGPFTRAYALESGRNVQILSKERDVAVWVDGQRAGGNNNSLVDVSRIVK
jgi:hypothetical protein